MKRLPDAFSKATRSNEWLWKKRQEGVSWVTIKNVLRTMQRVLSCSSKGKKPPFSQEGLAIPERDKLRMQIESREAVSFRGSNRRRLPGNFRSSTIWMMLAKTDTRWCSFLHLPRVCAARNCLPCE